jgi:hypothetical protein
MSRATITASKNGTFGGQMVSIDGNGPTGEIEGQRALDGGMTFHLKGQGCSNVNVETTLPQYHLPAK